MARPQQTLKQRLAALASVPTSPSSSTGSARPAHGRKRSLFSPPWTRRGAPVELSASDEERDRVQDVMGRMIYQAGTCPQPFARVPSRMNIAT